MPLMPTAICYYNKDKELQVWSSSHALDSSGWIDQAYRTITLAEPATGEFLTWLQANAVKQ